jgi:hypothetical protein
MLGTFSLAVEERLIRLAEGMMRMIDDGRCGGGAYG